MSVFVGEALLLFVLMDVYTSASSAAHHHGGSIIIMSTRLARVEPTHRAANHRKGKCGGRKSSGANCTTKVKAPSPASCDNRKDAQRLHAKALLASKRACIDARRVSLPARFRRVGREQCMTRSFNIVDHGSHTSSSALLEASNAILDLT